MLMPNSILFMSYFESIYLCWGFTPFITLFSTFFRIVRFANAFYYFGPKAWLSIFTSYKNLIKG